MADKRFQRSGGSLGKRGFSFEENQTLGWRDSVTANRGTEYQVSPRAGENFMKKDVEFYDEQIQAFQ